MENLSGNIIEKFLADIKDLDNEKYLILKKCREIIFALNPEIAERIIYGGIMFAKQNEDIGGIFPSKKHISFEFSKGFELDDPDGLLEGKGKYRRHLKLKSFADINDKQVKKFAKQVMMK